MSHTIQSGTHIAMTSLDASGVSYSVGNIPVITGLNYDNISLTGVSIYWHTDVPADTKNNGMVSESNDQPAIFTDSNFLPDQIINHILPISNLWPATIYKYCVSSHNSNGIITGIMQLFIKGTFTRSILSYFKSQGKGVCKKVS